MSFPPIQRCGGLPYRKYGCAAAPRLGEKSIAKRCVSANTSLPRLVVHKVRLCRGASSWRKIQPKARRSFHILLCGGLPYTKYGCAGAPPVFYRAVRLSKKPVIASQCAHWRGNPFLKRTNSALFAGFCLKRYGFPRRCAPRSKCPWGTPRNDRGEVYRHAGRPVFTGRFSVAILPEVWYNRTNVGRQVCLCGYWASIPASPLWASG